MLHHRDDFADLLTTVGDLTGAGAAIVEKDYWVTEALRVIAASFSGGLVFKGGTSLSKAWHLIQRFSEDIDLLVRAEGEGFGTRGERDRYMRAIGVAVAEIDGLELLPDAGRSERGISRTVGFRFEPQASRLAGLQPTISLEMGIRGGPHPTAERTIVSMLAAGLEGRGVEDATLEPFSMTALDPRRTLVEKLFAWHSSCTLWGEGRETALDRKGRHLYDIFFLLGDSDVSAFVGTEDYWGLIPEIDEVGRTYFPLEHRTPDDMTFATSPSVYPDGALRVAIEAEYARSEFLFYGGFPDLPTIYERIGRFRERL